MPVPLPSEATALFAPPLREPLAIHELPPESHGEGAKLRRVEFGCRGDRALLELLLPETGAPCPVALIQPAPDRAGGLASLEGIGDWLARGFGVASLGLPLFGARRSAKLSEKLEKAIAGAEAGAPCEGTDRILWAEFTRQSVLELRRAVDVLEETVGASAVAFAGAGLAAKLGAIFCALDPRPRAVVLVGMGRAAPPGLEPASYLETIAPRTVHRLDEADRLDETALAGRALPLLAPALAKGR